MGDNCDIMVQSDCYMGIASSSGRTALQACCICGGGGSSRPSPTSASTKAPTRGSGFASMCTVRVNEDMKSGTMAPR